MSPRAACWGRAPRRSSSVPPPPRPPGPTALPVATAGTSGGSYKPGTGAGTETGTDRCQFSLDGTAFYDSVKVDDQNLKPTRRRQDPHQGPHGGRRGHLHRLPGLLPRPRRRPSRTSGEQVFVDFDTVTVKPGQTESLDIAIPDAGCFAQIDLYRGAVEVRRRTRRQGRLRARRAAQGPGPPGHQGQADRGLERRHEGLHDQRRSETAGHLDAAARRPRPRRRRPRPRSPPPRPRARAPPNRPRRGPDPVAPRSPPPPRPPRRRAAAATSPRPAAPARPARSRSALRCSSRAARASW